MKLSLISKQENTLSIREQCALLEISRSSFYYKLLDAHILEEPTAGVLTMQSMLLDKNLKVGRERVRRLMRKANIYPIYPKRHLSQMGNRKYIYPYLIRNLDINRPNQVWEIDITYVPMQSGFMYLTAIIDVYSRMIVGWGLSNTLSKSSVMLVVEKAIKDFGKPEIINSDQGSQFTCKEYVSYLKQEHIKSVWMVKGMH